ncbi:MAG: DUF1801 domain-containing protein [Chitinophagaceae bacterium]|nr:DUF1801 domain-containing protein [Chitinophagaceae bacterium]
MTSTASTVEEYLKELPQDRKDSFSKLRETILKNLPKGFEETMSYGMIGYVVPHSVYPPGYHCDPKLPLPFMALASQKHSINFYHMGIYSSPDLLKWFTDEYPKHAKGKLDMGKSCMRFKKEENIPFALIGELVKKVSAQDWIRQYEHVHKDMRKK